RMLFGLCNAPATFQRCMLAIFQDMIEESVEVVGVKISASSSVSKPSGNTKKNRISQTSSSNQKNKVEDHLRSIKSSSNKKNRVSECNASTKHDVLDGNSKFVCSTCNECLFNACHDMCVVDFLNDMNVRDKYRWTFTIDGNKCPLTRITSTIVLPPKKPIPTKVVKKTPPRKNNLGKPKATTSVIQVVLWYLDSGCSKHMTGRRSQLINFVSKFMGTIRFGNDQVAAIMGYVAFRKHTFVVRDLEGIDLLTGSTGTNLYTLLLEDMMKSSPICLLSKSSKTKAWLWHRRLSHLNLGTINQQDKQGLVRGSTKLKYEKDHLFSVCTQPKRSRNAAWYKDRAMLAEAQKARQILDKEQLAFLTDLRVIDGQSVQTIIPNNATFQTEDLDTYDSDCDDISNAKAVLMANISNYGSDVITDVPHSETYLNDMENQGNLKKEGVAFPKTMVLESVEAFELSAKQAFWLHMSNPTNKPSDASPVKIEAPKELPKVSLVNESLKKLKFHLARFDNVVKIRTTPDARTEEFFENNDLKAQLQDKDTTICKLKDIIKSIREKSKEENVNYDYGEIETKNVELENNVAKFLSENERLCNEINHVKRVFKEQFDSIKKTRVRTKEQSDSLIDKLNLKSTENEDLKAQIQTKVFMITSLKNDLRKLKGKEIINIAAQTPSAYTIILGMFKLDLEPLAPRLLQNREAHIDYLKYTQEQADIL
ncbi:retrovirus-related pol polyprotein from transposon TNT 1-94, partial [Tanacetum coccineum]